MGWYLRNGLDNEAEAVGREMNEVRSGGWFGFEAEDGQSFSPAADVEERDVVLGLSRVKT